MISLVGIAGPAGCGKDTVAKYLRQLTPEFQIMSFATPMKDMLKVGLGLTTEQLYGEEKEVVDSRYGKTPREMLQTLGTEWGRKYVNEDLWPLALLSKAGTRPTIIPDVRFENEARLIRERGGLIVHITGRAADINGVEGHASEKGVMQDLHDWVIINKGSTADLFDSVESLAYYIDSRASLYANSVGANI